jgi:septal ring factor EnvC (AmiA/AmiB activator)
MDDDPTPEPPPADDLAARRKDLEREFVEKHRDLKAQDKRRRDSLELEKAEFESYRRAKGKELADREEKLRRTAANKEAQVRATSGDLEELESLRRQAKEHGAAEWRRKKDLADLEAKAAAARAEAAALRGLVAYALVLVAAATVAWLALAGASPKTELLAAATLLAIGLLAWRRQRVGRRNKPKA